MTSRRAERGEPAGGQSRGVEDAQHAALAAPLGAAADLRDAHDQAHEDRLGPAGEQLRVDVVAHLPTCLRGAHRVGDVACEPAERGQACEPGQRIGFVATDDRRDRGWRSSAARKHMTSIGTSCVTATPAARASASSAHADGSIDPARSESIGLDDLLLSGVLHRTLRDMRFTERRVAGIGETDHLEQEFRDVQQVVERARRNAWFGGDVLDPELAPVLSAIVAPKPLRYASLFAAAGRSTTRSNRWREPHRQS